MKKIVLTSLLTGFAVLSTACASGGTSTPTPNPSPSTDTDVRARTWPVKTRENVDLWLHGFALLQQDSTPIPLFRRGYRDELTVLKNQANVITQLDVNIDRLREQGRANRSLLNAQFLPLYFSSMEQMHAAIDRFIAVNGNPSAASSQDEAIAFAVLGGYFQDAKDRAWLSLFASSLWDESNKFYHSYWMQQQRARSNVIDSVQGMWQNNVRPRLQRFLNNTQQPNSDILLSLPLDGEGRTLSSGPGRPVVCVTFPERPSDAQDAIYVILHEVVGTVANNAVGDNVTPAEQRNGVADKLASAAAVRGGLMLAEKQLPEFADGYASYYVRAAGRTPNANPRTQLASLFPLPAAVIDAMSRQMEIVQGGI